MGLKVAASHRAALSGDGLKVDAEIQALLPTLTSAASAGVDDRPLGQPPQVAVKSQKDNGRMPGIDRVNGS
jgi:hypothetical protein